MVACYPAGLHSESILVSGDAWWTKPAFSATFCNMRGRPKKSRLEPKWIESRNRWQVVVPASWTGKRFSSFFETETAALLWISDRERERIKGVEISTSRESKDGEKTINVLVGMYEKEKEKLAGLRQIQNHLKKLKAKFGGLTFSELSAFSAKAWIFGLNHSPRTRWGIYTTCRTFAGWAARYKFTKSNPFEEMEAPDKGAAPKAILTPMQMARLLDFKTILKEHAILVPDYMRAWMVLGAFAGLRSAEIFRMSWSDLHFEEEEIHVPRTAIKKTRGGMRERYVKMLPAFLDLCPRKEGGQIVPVTPGAFIKHSARLSLVILGLKKWPHNALRHSFASYHLAMWEDAGKTAFQMGHTSTDMVHQNYARAVKKSAAEIWWKMRRDNLREIAEYQPPPENILRPKFGT